ncbi:hypothetical protein [Flavobacterium aestivum]|uniref:hypothetical protein n=1 Tax=Flavobacterium aestivum TaxID=3003257 RepID=UPI0024821D85|nr:hypothetical protein [Flavobacterium aestivum]
MKDIVVEINGSSFKMSFSLKVFRILGQVWNLETLPEVMQRVALIEQISTQRLDIYDVLFELLFQSIDCHPENVVKIKKEDIENLSVSELMVLADGMAKGITEAFKQTEQSEKKTKAPRKPRK